VTRWTDDAISVVVPTRLAARDQPIVVMNRAGKSTDPLYRFGNVIGARMTHGVIFDFVGRLRQDPRELLVRGDGRQEKNYFLVEECIDGMLYGYSKVAMNDDIPCGYSILELRR